MRRLLRDRNLELKYDDEVPRGYMDHRGFRDRRDQRDLEVTALKSVRVDPFTFDGCLNLKHFFDYIRGMDQYFD